MVPRVPDQAVHRLHGSPVCRLHLRRLLLRANINPRRRSLDDWHVCVHNKFAGFEHRLTRVRIFWYCMTATHTFYGHRQPCCIRLGSNDKTATCTWPAQIAAHFQHTPNSRRTDARHFPSTYASDRWSPRIKMFLSLSVLLPDCTRCLAAMRAVSASFRVDGHVGTVDETGVDTPPKRCFEPSYCHMFPFACHVRVCRL